MLVRRHLRRYGQRGLSLSVSAESLGQGLSSAAHLSADQLLEWRRVRGNRCVNSARAPRRDNVSVSAFGARCNCSDGYSGEYCQYKTVKPTVTLSEDAPRVEYKQFDAETLAVIANLGSSTNDNSQRTIGVPDSVAVPGGNHSQFVFCLTNPCENGGTCFVTNTATTKVRHCREVRL